MSPDDVIALMKKGNERFRLGQESPHDYLAQQRATATGQYPAAAILSCIDSRAPAETIMARLAGERANTGTMLLPIRMRVVTAASWASDVSASSPHDSPIVMQR